MIYVDKGHLKMYKWTYLDPNTHKCVTKRYSELQVYHIAYTKYNEVFTKYSIISSDVLPLSKKAIDSHIKQLLGIIGCDSQALFSVSLENYFYTLFAGELQCQMLN